VPEDSTSVLNARVPKNGAQENKKKKRLGQVFSIPVRAQSER